MTPDDASRAFEKWWTMPGTDDMSRVKTPYKAAKTAWLAAWQAGQARQRSRCGDCRITHV